MKNYHLIVIGAGSGGLVAAAGAAGLGAKVALIEKHKMGGDCLNTGCVPSKAIIRTAKLAHDMRTAQRFGLSDIEPEIDFKKIMDSVKDARQKLEPHDSIERFESLGVDVHLGQFKFISSNQISDGQTILTAKKFVIATGASPFIPPIQGLDDIPYLTSDNVWDLKELPKKLIVLGGGPIGVELAQVFARLGSQVTLVEMMDRLLLREDPEFSQMIHNRLNQEGLEVLTGFKAEKIEDHKLKVTHKNKGSQDIPFDQILVAVGRAPNVQDLGLKIANVECSSKGIQTNQYLQTTNKSIYACGDVVGPYQFTHTADFQARLILRNALFPGKSAIDYKVVPWCTFTDPEVARVGLNETEAKQKNIAYDLFTYDFKDLDRAVCDREDLGLLKVLTKKGKDKIIGITIAGPHAGDLLHELTLAMHQGIGLKKVAQMIHVYPTLAEISKRLADTYQKTRLSPKMKIWFTKYFSWRFD